MSMRRAPYAPDSARQRIWQSMRIMRRFTRVDLAMTAEVSPAAVNGYIMPLMRAGYVAKVRERQRTGRGCVAGDFSVYRLVQNTGPHAPRHWRTRGLVYDVNLHQERPA